MAQQYIELHPQSNSSPSTLAIDVQGLTDGQILSYSATKKAIVGGTDIAGIISLGGLTANTQLFAVGTTGTDFGVSSATATHTFNLPTASATNRGALSSADWTTFNGKLTSPLTTKGDVLAFSTVNARLPVGTDGQILSALSTETTGLKWITMGLTMVYVAQLTFNAGSNPTVVENINTLVGTTTNAITWTRNSAGFIFGTPDAGVYPTLNKGFIHANFVSGVATGAGGTLWTLTAQKNNSPRRFELATYSNISGTITQADATAQIVDVFIIIAP